MCQSPLFVGVLSAVMLVAIAQIAFAQKATKKISFDEAWTRCSAKAHIDRTVPWFEHSQRHSLGAACMQKFG
jgi:hypothetical protein